MKPDLKKKIDRAIKLLKAAERKAAEVGQPVEICYSGGKDSEVILELAKMAGINYRAIYKNTTIDPPGTISHVLRKGVEMVRPKITFVELMKKKVWPSRQVRFCCSELKEYKILDYAVVGIRREESRKRAERYQEPEICRVYNAKEKTRQYLPILDWTLQDVVDFLKERDIQCAPHYYDADGEFHPERRLGCMGCPMMSRKQRIREFERHPNMVKLYLRGATLQGEPLHAEESAVFSQHLRVVCVLSLLREHQRVQSPLWSQPVQRRRRLQRVSGELFPH